MKISKGAEKSYDEIQHPFTMETLNKLGIEGNFLNLIKDIYKKPTTTIILNGKRQCFLPKIRNTKRISALTTSIQHCVRRSWQGNFARKCNKICPH